MPVPEIGEREILMRVIASGICGSDVMEWYRRDKVPLVLGHEVAGDIVEVGKKVSKFKLKNIEAKGKLKRPDIRITIDTIEDFELIEKIIQNFNNQNFKAAEIIDFLDRNPDILEINKNIKQKSVRSI